MSYPVGTAAAPVGATTTAIRATAAPVGATTAAVGSGEEREHNERRADTRQQRRRHGDV